MRHHKKSENYFIRHVNENAGKLRGCVHRSRRYENKFFDGFVVMVFTADH